MIARAEYEHLVKDIDKIIEDCRRRHSRRLKDKLKGIDPSISIDNELERRMRSKLDRYQADKPVADICKKYGIELPKQTERGEVFDKPTDSQLKIPKKSKDDTVFDKQLDSKLKIPKKSKVDTVFDKQSDSKLKISKKSKVDTVFDKQSDSKLKIPKKSKFDTVFDKQSDSKLKIPKKAKDEVKHDKSTKTIEKKTKDTGTMLPRVTKKDVGIDKPADFPCRFDEVLLPKTCCCHKEFAETETETEICELPKETVKKAETQKPTGVLKKVGCACLDNQNSKGKSILKFGSDQNECNIQDCCENCVLSKTCACREEEGKYTTKYQSNAIIGRDVRVNPKTGKRYLHIDNNVTVPKGSLLSLALNRSHERTRCKEKRDYVCPVAKSQPQNFSKMSVTFNEVACGTNDKGWAIFENGNAPTELAQTDYHYSSVPYNNEIEKSLSSLSCKCILTPEDYVGKHFTCCGHQNF